MKKEKSVALVQQLNNKQGHIELLLESDRELERIKNISFLAIYGLCMENS